MKLSLKRAHVLALAAFKMATESHYDGTLTLSIYAPNLAQSADPEQLESDVQAARAETLRQYQLSIDLIAAFYRIRQQLAEVNLHQDISQLLAIDKQLTAEMGRVTALTRAIGEVSDSESRFVVAQAKANALRATPSETRYGLTREDTVTVSLFSEADAAEYRKVMKQITAKRAIINETLTVKNVSGTITLDEVTVKTLQRADLLSGS